MSSSTVKRRPDAGMDTSNIIEGPRKRARESTTAVNHFEQSNSKSPSPQATTPAPKKLTLKLKKQSGGGSMVGGEGKNPMVLEQGMKLWNAVKNAKDASGQSLSVDFLELPNKKDWPDYYVVIQNPISLKEIKNKLDRGEYSSARAVKGDFDTMWNNAKQYNVPGSGIYINADNLHKLVQREFTTITGESGDMDVDTPAPTEAKAADATSSSKAPKTRPPALGKLLKTRLQKLYKMTDDEGRQLCGVFMDPPSRRAYPTYYQIIKKVMTFNMIEKKIDRKEYENAEQFMEDVELIWSNAYTFNEEHSPVWEGAKVLQEAFRNLVSDLPAPYTLPPFEDSKAHAPPTKIKLKVKDHRARSTDSGAAASSSPTQEQAKPASPPQADPPAVTLTALPATITHRGSGTPGPAPSPAVPTPPIAPTGTSTPGPTYPPAGTPYGTTSQMPTQYPGYPYYPNAYQQPFAPYQAPTPAAQTPAPQIAQPAPTTTTAASQPTAPVASAKKPPHVKHIRALTIKTTPAGRRMRFENVEGLNLRMWSMRLGGGENGVELVDLEVYEKPIVPKQLKKAVVKKGKGKGKSDDSMDVDEGEDDEEGSGDDEAPNKSADGEIDVPVEVKLNNFPVTSSPAPVLSTPDTAPIASPIASPNGTMLNGNGHSVDAQSDSELTDPDDAPKTRSSGKSKGKAGARNSKTRKVSKSGSKGGLKAGSDSNSVKTRVEPRIWVAGLKEGQNTLDVKVGSEQSETWRIFVDRVV